MINITKVWMRGDGTPFDPMKKEDLESKLPLIEPAQETNWHKYVSNYYGEFMEETNQYVLLKRNGYIINIRKPW